MKYAQLKQFWLHYTLYIKRVRNGTHFTISRFYNLVIAIFYDLFYNLITIK